MFNIVNPGPIFGASGAIFWTPRQLENNARVRSRT
jgi:hypothetical protein